MNRPREPVPAAVIKLCAITERAPSTEVRNSFQALQDGTVEEEDEGFTVPASDGGSVKTSSAPGRWNIWTNVTGKKQRKSEALDPSKALPDSEDPSGGAVKRDHSVQMSSLIEVTVDSLNGSEEEVAEWEDIEFLVDGGAETTVIGPEDVKAVRASDPDPSRTYKLADGSLIQNKGHKTFNAVTEDNQIRNLGAHDTDVDKPLLSVSQVVAGGSEVVLSASGSYIASPTGEIPIELQGMTYVLKMWVPQNQEQPV